MFEEKIQELQTNKEFMDKLAKVHDVKGYVELFAEYEVEITEAEATDIYKVVLEAKEEMQNGDAEVELSEEALDDVNGGFATVVICGLAIPKILAGTMLALVAIGGAAHAIAKIKKKMKEMGF